MTDCTNKKPFDLERAIAGEPVVTRDGRNARFVHYEQSIDDGKRDCVTSVIDGMLMLFNSKGEYLCGQSHHLDLFMAPKIKTYWFATSWRGDGMRSPTFLYDSREKLVHFHADCDGSRNFIIHSIEIEE